MRAQSEGGREVLSSDALLTSDGESSSAPRLLTALGLEAPVSLSDLLVSLILAVPWLRLAAWLLFAAVSYALRGFAGLAGATFILSFTGNSVISLGASRFPGRRRLFTLLWFGAIVLSVTCIGLVTIPSVAREGAELLSRVQAEDPALFAAQNLRQLLGERLTAMMERLLALLQSSTSFAPGGKPPSAEELAWLAQQLEPGAVDSSQGSARLGAALAAAAKQHAATAVQLASAALAAAGKGAVQGLLSLVLSFIIVWDLPGLRRGLASLRASRLGWAYCELAPPLASFGVLFARALQAQFLVAVVNTALTSAGMVFLQLPGVAFLAALVFVFSFIPVAGVIISTVPIGFVALTEYGVGRLLAVVVMVVIAHAIEAYLLNPAIYAAHLKLHPLIVLVVLVMAEHSLGVWGLLLAVPLSVFALELLRSPEQKRKEREQRVEARVTGT